MQIVKIERKTKYLMNKLELCHNEIVTINKECDNYANRGHF
jgi:hypothetical protein